MIADRSVPLDLGSLIKGKQRIAKDLPSELFNGGRQHDDKSVQDQAFEEVEKDQIKDKEKSNQKLDELVNSTGQVLYRLKAVFPFDFFPTEIIIDKNKVNLIFNEFFFSKHIHSVMVTDVTDVMVETNLFFATLKIIDKFFNANSIDVGYLNKDEAMMARRIIQGLVVAQQQQIDLSKVQGDDLVKKIEQLGKEREGERKNIY